MVSMIPDLTLVRLISLTCTVSDRRLSDAVLISPFASGCYCVESEREGMMLLNDRFPSVSIVSAW